MLNLMKEGLGTMQYKDNSKYIGTWHNDLRCGHGELLNDILEVINRVESRYVGEFLDDLRHGLGEQLYSNGDLYSGLVKGGKVHG